MFLSRISLSFQSKNNASPQHDAATVTFYHREVVFKLMCRVSLFLSRIMFCRWGQTFFILKLSGYYVAFDDGWHWFLFTGIRVRKSNYKYTPLTAYTLE